MSMLENLLIKGRKFDVENWDHLIAVNLMQDRGYRLLYFTEIPWFRFARYDKHSSSSIVLIEL